MLTAISTKAITLANDCEYGLTSSIYTRNVSLAIGPSTVSSSARPTSTITSRGMQGFHAGWRKSGIGGADSKHGLLEYLQTHVAYISKAISLWEICRISKVNLLLRTS